MNTENIKDTLKTTFADERTPKVEGQFTKTVENQTAKIPSISWLGLAAGSMVVSAGLQLFSEKKELSNFIGQWAPCFLMIGIYNKIVKVEGNDELTHSKNLH